MLTSVFGWIELGGCWNGLPYEQENVKESTSQSEDNPERRHDGFIYRYVKSKPSYGFYSVLRPDSRQSWVLCRMQVVCHGGFVTAQDHRRKGMYSAESEIKAPGPVIQRSKMHL